MIDALTIGDPELPSMPGTYQSAIFDCALSQWSPSVRTDAAQGSEDAVHMDNADRLRPKPELAHFALGWKIGEMSNMEKQSHFRNVTPKTHYIPPTCGVAA